MAHSQKSIRDHARNRSHPNVDNQLAYYRGLGMRERILGLPLMLAAILTLVWRQVPSARELNRMLARENLLWAKATKVSQQAFSQRLLTFPASMFELVLTDRGFWNYSLFEQLRQLQSDFLTRLKTNANTNQFQLKRELLR